MLQGLEETPGLGAIAAARRVAAVFAGYVHLYTPPGSSALVQDSKLLHIASALLNLGPPQQREETPLAPAGSAHDWVLRVVVALADPLDVLLAEVGSRSRGMLAPCFAPAAAEHASVLLGFRVCVLRLRQVGFRWSWC